MTKPSIVTRASKGSALTWTEGDTNLTNLRDATITIKAGSGGTDVVSDLNGTVTLVAGTNVTLSGDNTAKTVTINAAGGSGITDLVQDTSPQLGGNLDVQNYQITTSTANEIRVESANGYDITLNATGANADINIQTGPGNINITPGMGKAIIDGLSWPTSDGTSNQVLKTDGAGNLGWATMPTDTNTTYGISAETATGGVNLRLTGSDSSTDDVKLAQGSNITLTRTDANTITIAASSGGIASVSADASPSLGGDLNVNGYKIVSTSGPIEIAPSTNGNVQLNATGTGTVDLSTGSGNISITSGTGVVALSTARLNAGKELRFMDSDASNYVGFKAPATITADKIWTLPSADGTNGQVLSTNGSGTLSWATAGGGGPAVSIVEGTITFQEFTNMSTSETTLPHTWTEKSDTSGMVTVSADTFTISSAGTYFIEYNNNFITSFYANSNGANLFTMPEMTIKLYNSSDTTTLGTTKIGGNKLYYNTTNTTSVQQLYGNVQLSAVVTITGSKNFTIRYGITAGSSFSGPKFVYTNSPNLPQVKITKLA